MNELETHYIYDAQQSNFRTLSLLTDPNGLSPKILALQDYFHKGTIQRDEVNAIIFKLTEVLTQCTYTGRCLGGVMTPNASVHTDQRPQALKKREHTNG